ncbi:unnamed protein product, partial [Symbiodinium sp. CCMP2456]
MRKRMELWTKWRAWASALERPEAELHKALDGGVASVLRGKKLLLLERIAQSLGWPDGGLFEDIKSGFSLVGSASVTGVFETSFKAAEFTEDELDSRAKFLRPALWGKIASSATQLDQELWQKTLAERDDKGWISGPYTYEELDGMFGPTWLPVRRFGIRQRAKLRCIDDLSENAVNASWEVAEKIDLRALDELLWVASRLMKIMLDKGYVDLQLSDGSKMACLSALCAMLCLSVDWRVLVTLIVWLLQRIMLELGCMAFNYFDDYPVLDLSLTSGSTEKTIRALMVQNKPEKASEVAASVDKVLAEGSWALYAICRRAMASTVFLVLRQLCTVGGVLYARLQGVTRVRHLIGLVELYALVLARFVWKDYLDHQRALFFLDHSGALASAIKCSSRDELWRELLLQLEIADKGSCIAWYARVPSASNAADPPSKRHERLKP